MNSWPSRATGVLISIAAAQLVTAGVIFCVADQRRDAQLLAGLVLGLMFGQISCLAIWVVLGPLPGVIRWPGALAGCLLSTFMGIVTFGSDAGTDLLEVIFVLLAAALVLFVGVQIPLWWLRLRRGFQLQLPGKGALESGIGETQFSLRQLLVTTTIVALALGAGRVVAATINWDASGGQQQIHWPIFLIFGLIVVFSIGVVWLALGTSFSSVTPAIAVPLGIVLVAPLSWLEATTFAFLFPNANNSENVLVMTLINYTQTTWLLACLLALRWAGYRLQRTKVAAPSS